MQIFVLATFASRLRGRTLGFVLAPRKAERLALFRSGGTLGRLRICEIASAIERVKQAISSSPVAQRKRFSRHTLRKRFRTACRSLGAERLATLTIHHGKHTFISHALAGGRTLAEVGDTVGHANISITSAYLQVAVEDDAVGMLFGIQ